MNKIEKKHKVFIQYDEYRTGGELESEDEWSSRTPEDVDVTVGNLLATSDVYLGGASIDVDFDPQDYIDKALYIVFVRYSTGDSFGTSSGNPDFPAVCTTSSKAFNIAKQIKTDSWVDPRGYCPWKGHFESLDSVEVLVKQLLDNK
jgi:hypothetical protein